MTGADAEQSVALAETLGDWPACLVVAVREAAKLASTKDRLSCLPFVRGAQRFLTDPSASSPRAPFLFNKALNATAVSCSTPAVLQRLVCDKDPSVRGSLARNPNSPPAILAELAGAEVEAIRKDVAENPATPGHVLDQLANDASWVVRYALAGNPAAPASALAHLTHDESWNVRYTLAGHPTLPAAAFDRLSVDMDTDIRARLADNTAGACPTQGAVDPRVG